MNIDNKITELFEVLNKQKAEVQKSQNEIKQPWKTNCSFSWSNNDKPINIQTANVSDIIKLLTQLLEYSHFHREASNILGVDVDELYNGYSIDSWIHDFKKRISVIQIKDKQQKLTALEQRLDALVSPEQRRLLELEKITKELL